MSKRALRHTALVLALASFVSFVPVPASQAEPRGGRSESAFTAAGDRGFSLWSFLTTLLAKAGVRIDDNGNS